MKPVIQEEIRKQDEAAGIVRSETGGAVQSPRSESGRFIPRAPYGDGGTGGWSDRLARKSGVSARTIERVERVSRQAPDLIPKMRSGEIGQGKAEQVVRERKAAERVAKQNGKAREKRREEPSRVKSYLSAIRSIPLTCRAAAAGGGRSWAYSPSDLNRISTPSTCHPYIIQCTIEIFTVVLSGGR